jgi:hypothetical protein
MNNSRTFLSKKEGWEVKHEESEYNSGTLLFVLWNGGEYWASFKILHPKKLLKFITKCRNINGKKKSRPLTKEFLTWFNKSENHWERCYITFIPGHGFSYEAIMNRSKIFITLIDKSRRFELTGLEFAKLYSFLYNIFKSIEKGK